MGKIRCFFLEPTGRVSVRLRRYTRVERVPCTEGSYHDASVHFCSEPKECDAKGYGVNSLKPAPSHSDPRWPQTCTCGYTFRDDDEWQRFTQDIYRRTDTGEEGTLRDAAPGAMWYAWWFDTMYQPQGAHCLVVKTPGSREWIIDSQASNCTMPDDRRQEKHHCWILHGTPPDVTVDKQGQTCAAGPGSVQCGKWHGFLRNGYLED